MVIRTALIGLITAVVLSGSVDADEAISFPGGHGLLVRPPGKPIGSLIILPGGPDGKLHRNGNMVRHRHAFARAGYMTLVVDGPADFAQAVAYMRSVARPVVIVAVSGGAMRAHGSIPARPDGIVLANARIDRFQRNVGDPSVLPPILIVHHRRDGCRVTSPGLVEPFTAWAGSRARVKWVDGGVDHGDPCRGHGYHGFVGVERELISGITSFARSLR